MASFPPLQNDLLLRTARGESTRRTPAWMMRQAGRYLPEYRAVREEHSFFEVVETPELAAQVTLQPVDRLPVETSRSDDRGRATCTRRVGLWHRSVGTYFDKQHRFGNESVRRDALTTVGAAMFHSCIDRRAAN